MNLSYLITDLTGGRMPSSNRDLVIKTALYAVLVACINLVALL